MNILVAVDFSDASQKILEEVKTLATGLSAKVWLLHVAEPKPGFIGYTGRYVDYGPDFVDYGPDPKTTRAQIAQKFHKEHKELQKEGDKLRKAGIDTTALLVQGSIIDVILQESNKLEVDMVVVGSHGHGAVHDFIIGSASKGVLKRSSCPVLVIPTHDRS